METGGLTEIDIKLTQEDGKIPGGAVRKAALPGIFLSARCPAGSEAGGWGKYYSTML